MTLRRKTLLIIGVTVACLVGLLYALSRAILIQGFVELERSESIENAERALNALNVQRDNLTTIVLGYSNWDDTYQFVNDANSLYVERNMIDSTFSFNQVNFIVILNNDLDVVFGKGYDLIAEEEIPVPEGLYQHFVVGDELVTFESTTDVVDGILLLPEGPALIASLPILTSDGAGPANGVTIWGRFLDAAALSRIADATQHSIAIERLDTGLLRDDFESARAFLSDGETFAVTPIGDRRVAAYTFVNDIYGNPALMLRVDEPRAIYARGQYSVAYLLLSIIVGGAFLIVIMIILLEVLVLSRLSKLSTAVTQVRSTGDLNTPIPVSGSDEIANLAYGIRGMLSGQAQARVALQETNEILESRVTARTKELTMANARLREEIAEREKIQSDLAQARDQAVDALRLKTQILANVSHDARTPLTTIMLRTELFQLGRYGAISEEQRKVFEVIFQNARQLLAFVNNLVTEAQLNREGFEIVREPFSPTALLEETYRAMLPLAERKGLLFGEPTLENMPNTIYGDQVRIRQILTNLVDNAIKFTDHGTITLAMRRLNQDELVLKVADTGKGIPQDVIHRIYEPFWQLDSSKTRDANRGVGLGLSIVKQLAKLLGGDVNVKSEVGSGTTFSVVLPLHTEHEEETDESSIRNGH